LASDTERLAANTDDESIGDGALVVPTLTPSSSSSLIIVRCPGDDSSIDGLSIAFCRESAAPLINDLAANTDVVGVGVDRNAIFARSSTSLLI
jgi:hypothetical protein